MIDIDLKQWRAERAARHVRKSKLNTPKANPIPATATHTPHPDPLIDTTRRIDAAAELIAPALTDGVLLLLIKRVLAAGRLELCDCLEAIAADTVHTHAFEREFAAALRSYITFRVHADQAAACLGCHRERCAVVGGATK